MALLFGFHTEQHCPASDDSMQWWFFKKNKWDNVAEIANLQLAEYFLSKSSLLERVNKKIEVQGNK